MGGAGRVAVSAGLITKDDDPHAKVTEPTAYELVATFTRATQPGVFAWPVSSVKRLFASSVML